MTRRVILELEVSIWEKWNSEVKGDPGVGDWDSGRGAGIPGRGDRKWEKD
jgi:hypothetical protein